MRAFSNWKILFKLLTLVGAMSLVIAIVAAVGVHGVTVLDQEAEQVAVSGFDSALGERIHQDVLGLNRRGRKRDRFAAGREAGRDRQGARSLSAGAQ